MCLARKPVGQEVVNAFLLKAHDIVIDLLQGKLDSGIVIGQADGA